MTATPLLGIYKNVFLNDSEPEILACVFYLYIFNETGVLLDGAEDLQASQRTVILPFNLKWQSMQSKWDSNFIVSIGEQLDRSLRKWQLLWVIECFFCRSLLGSTGKIFQMKQKQDY